MVVCPLIMGSIEAYRKSDHDLFFIGVKMGKNMWRVSRHKTQKYLFDHYLHFLKLHIINNYINSLIIWSRRLPLRPHVVAGIGATFMEKKIPVY